MPQLISVLVSVLVLALLLAPPALALLMVLRRLRLAVPERRTPYHALVALVGLVIVFNLLVWVGMPEGLRGLLPDLIGQNLGYTALLASWGALGLCVLLAVLHPRRRRSSI